MDGVALCSPPNASDKGIDVVALRAVAKVKSTFRTVTPYGYISQLAGDASDNMAHAGKVRLFYAPAYSAAAIAKAVDERVALLVLTVAGDVTAVNDPAKELVQRTSGGAASAAAATREKRVRELPAPPTGPHTVWDRDKVAAWLEAGGYDEAIVAALSPFEGSDLQSLTDDMLKELKVSAAYRMTMLKAISKLP